MGCGSGGTEFCLCVAYTDSVGKIECLGIAYIHNIICVCSVSFLDSHLTGCSEVAVNGSTGLGNIAEVSECHLCVHEAEVIGYYRSGILKTYIIVTLLRLGYIADSLECCDRKLGGSGCAV